MKNLNKKDSCPPATYDLKTNTVNRDATIKEFNYGPLNVDEPGEYWDKIAEYWDTTVEAAQKSICGNCVAFDISPRMKDCMPGETSDEDGELGYCWMHHFKCHSARSCHTWAKGGPIVEDGKSLDWQSRSTLKEAKKLGSFKDFFEENFMDGKKKGKSRPGRAKRAGVDCSKSKTELRKIAKNSSGEKQKMAHFCANMKSGKKKSSDEEEDAEKKVSKTRAKCQAKAKRKYDVWPSAYASGYVQKCVNRGGNIK